MKVPKEVVVIPCIRHSKLLTGCYVPLDNAIYYNDAQFIIVLHRTVLQNTTCQCIK
jgi:hypothetical protein